MRTNEHFAENRKAKRGRGIGIKTRFNLKVSLLDEFTAMTDEYEITAVQNESKRLVLLTTPNRYSCPVRPPSLFLCLASTWIRLMFWYQITNRYENSFIYKRTKNKRQREESLQL